MIIQGTEKDGGSTFDTIPWEPNTANRYMESHIYQQHYVCLGLKFYNFYERF